MSTYGFQPMEKIGTTIQVTADGAPIAKAGGVTVDWSLVAAAGADVTFENDDVVYAGEKFLRYGQILAKVTATGKYAPYGAAGTSAVKGDCFIVNESWHENQPHSDHPPVIDGGRVWQQRLLVVGFGEATAPAGVTLMPRAAFEAAFPMITYVTE